MSDQDNFLTRWSRRKLEPADDNVRPDKPAADGGDAEKPVAARVPEAAAPQTPPVPKVDLTKLPSIESIGANSDITAFLQAGVPSALRHAALRRAWVTDPAIRDFIGPSENAWDFTDPKAMPGFGELDPSIDIKKLVAEIFGEAAPETKSPAGATTPPPEQVARLPEQSGTTAGVPAGSEPLATEPQLVSAPKGEASLQRDENIATQQDDPKLETAALKVPRHGGAMPR
jgi:hypothetical protein